MNAAAQRASWRRLFGVLVGAGFRAAPLTAGTLLVMSVISAASSVCYSLGFRYVIDGAIARDSGRVVLGSLLVAVLFTLSWLLAIRSATQGVVLTDRCTVVTSVRIARLVARFPTLQLFEDWQLLGTVEQLTGNRRTLAGAPRQLIALFGQALRAIGIVVLLATVYVPVLVVPLLALAPGFSDRWAARVQQRATDALAEDRRLLADLFSLATSADSARELRTYGISEALAARHAELTERIRRRATRAAILSALLEGTGWVVFAAGVIGAIVVLVLRTAHGHVSPGSVVMAVSLMRRAQTQISRSTDTATSFNTSVSTASQLLWLEDLTAEAERRAGSDQPPEALRDGIALRSVSFRYPSASGDSDAETLHEVDLWLPAGKTIALVGENGAGKTTLVKLLCGLYAPSAGEITVDGTELGRFATDPWRRRITAAFQDFQRLHFALAESVGVGELSLVEEHSQVLRALDQAGAGELVQKLPDGLATRVGNRFTGGRELSGGQWQRLALARGLMRQLPLLTVLDEPTASLDASSESALFARYAEAAKRLAAANGGITLIVSHRFSTVRSADLIVVMDAGRVVETGSHDELMAAGGTYAELFALQARAYA